MEHAEKLFIDVARQYDTWQDIEAKIEELFKNKELTKDEYDYIEEEWDNLLFENGL